MTALSIYVIIIIISVNLFVPALFFCFVDIVDLRASIAQSATSVYQTLITTVNG